MGTDQARLPRWVAAVVVVALAAFGVVYSAPPASAATIVSDNFATGLGAWSVNDWIADSGSALFQGSVVSGAGAITRAVDTSTYQNVELEFDYLRTDASGYPLHVMVRPNGSASFTSVGSYSADAGWTTATIDVSAFADLASDFQLQFVVVPDAGGPVPAPVVVRVDNVVLTGDEDVVGPVVTLVSPADGSTIAHGVSQPFTVSVSDNISPAADLQVRYLFTSVSDPGETHLTSWATPTGGTYNANLSGNYFATNLGLAPGETFTWEAIAQDLAGNQSTTPLGTYTYSSASSNVAPTFSSAPPPNGTVGVTYASHTFTANGTQPVVFSEYSGTLPPGMWLYLGVLQGTPTTAGSYTFEIEAWNGTNPSDYAEYTVVISEPGTAPVFTSGPPPAGTVGVAYSHTLSASGDDPKVFTLGADPLPNGLTLAGGVISGTPTAAGSFEFDITVSNGVAPDDTETYTVVIAAAPVAPTITSGPPPAGTVGVAYSHTLTATGDGPISYSLGGDPLPGGLALVSGVISGTPTGSGSFTFEITATNGVAPDDVEEYTVVIAAAPVAPAITSGPPPAGTVGVAYSHTLTASGDGPVVFTLGGDPLPTGLALVGDVISGTPTGAGSFTFEITASNGVAPDDVEEYTVVIAAAGTPPTITSGPPPAGTVGAAYTHTLVATGDGPMVFSLGTDPLPPGLTLTGDVISGTPTSAGSFTFEITASNGVAPDDVEEYTVAIGAAPVPPTITLPAPADGTVGVAYTHTLTATGDGPMVFSLGTDPLPPGLTLTGDVIGGTPTSAGSFTFEITASNGVSPDDVEEYTVVIAPAPVAPTITSAAPPNGTGGAFYSHTFAASGTGTATFSLVSGALPPGLTLTGAVLSGTPTSAGNFAFTIVASNGTSPDASQQYVMVIAAAAGDQTLAATGWDAGALPTAVLLGFIGAMLIGFSRLRRGLAH